MSSVARSLALLALPVFSAVAGTTPPAATVAQRTTRFTYQAEIAPIEVGQGPVHVFIPIAQDDEHQTILSCKADTSIPGAVELEEANGNRFWHGVVPSADGQPIKVSFEYIVRRKAWRVADLDRSIPRDLSKAEREANASNLDAELHVPIKDPVLDPILAEIHAKAGTRGKSATARAIYDWLVDNLKYDKTGTGWGQGDVYWACSQRYGNCTDFHSLFNSLARTEGIPARFEIGFPIPADKPSGQLGGYHCWTLFYLPKLGWVPADASEAAKNKARREELYGGQPADRIHFTTGRDLRLSPDQQSGPLNFFIYPLVEVGGKKLDGGVTTKFTFEDLTAH